MPVRRRIRNHPATVGGGGGTSVSGGNIGWGPQFGGPAPYHPQAAGALDLNDVQFTGQFTTLGALDLTDVDFAGQLDPVQVLDLASVDLAGDAGVAGNLDTNVQFNGTLQTLDALDLASVDLTGALGSFGTLDLADVNFAGALNALGALSLATLELVRVNSSDDSWVEQANPGTNHGSDTDLEVRSANALGSGEERALIEFNLSTFTGFASSGGGDLVFYAAEQALLGSVNVSVAFHTFASDPFDEDTVTWNNQPSGTVQFTKTQTISDATFQEQRIALTASEIDSLLGKWVMLRFTNANTIDTPQIFVKSKEATDSTQRPRFENLTLVPV